MPKCYNLFRMQRRKNLPKLYTKHGDTGQTGLLYGGRVPKNDHRVEAYGAIDEANSALGMGKAFSESREVKEILSEIQRELFTVGAELATGIEKYEVFKSHFKPTTPEMTASLESKIDTLQSQVALPRAFIIPGGSPASAALDLGRSILRRAERLTVTLKQEGLLNNDEILRYLNRLADLIFILARFEDVNLPIELLSGRS